MENTKKNRFWRTARISGLFVREIIGWLLMLLGLNVFRISLMYLSRMLVIEGFVATIIAIVIFRSGLQLVKVAVAARAIRADRQAMSDTSSNREFNPAR